MNKLVCFNYNNGSSIKEYIYQRNIRGDIIGIFDDNGEQVGGYHYDGYGNQTITLDVNGIAGLNPFRYRGYFYDEETHLYYLNSRYYDSETGRFISPDTLTVLDETRGQINGLNLYMYCNDNPIMFVDPSGYGPEWWQWLISFIEISIGITLCFVPGAQGFGVTLIGTSVGSMINGYINETNGGTFRAGWFGGQVGGFVSLIPGVGMYLGAFLGSVATDGMDYGLEKIDWSKAFFSSAIAWAVGFFPGVTGEILSKCKIYDIAVYFIHAFNTIITSIANSIVNVFWRGKNEKKVS